MKKLKAFLLIWVIGSVAIYLMFAFGNWQYNPGKWTLDARGGMCGAIVMLMFISLPFVSMNEDL